MKVSPPALQSMAADIQIRDQAGPASGRVEGKTATETENVQNRPVCRQRAHFSAVLPLIEEETSLLTLQYICLKQQACLAEYDRPIWRRADENLAVLFAPPFSGAILDVSA